MLRVLFEHPKHKFKLMVKKIFYAQKFCLSKPVGEVKLTTQPTAISLDEIGLHDKIIYIIETVWSVVCDYMALPGHTHLLFYYYYAIIIIILSYI